MRPILAITMGDPAGIGPQIVARNLDTALQVSRPVIFGHWPSMARALDKFSFTPSIRLAQEATIPGDDEVLFVDTGPNSPAIEAPGEEAAKSQFSALEKATDAVLNGNCDALVTAPVSKALISSVHSGFLGHTEYLAARSGVSSDNVTMTFVGRELTIGLISTHLPMRKVADAITFKSLQRTLNHVIKAGRAISRVKRPKVAVAAFNPHAGEDGMFGHEEREILEPFCLEMAKRDDVELRGPISADAVFRDAVTGKYDGVLAAYHDQAMIPIKLLGFGKTVNVTMGLPFVRTSPDHGTAYDLVKSGKANPSAMKLAVETAVLLLEAMVESDRCSKTTELISSFRAP